MASWTASLLKPVAAAGMMAAALAHLAGCEAKSHLYDPVALTKARNLAVLPAVSAPGTDAERAGAMQASLIIGSLSQTGRFHVEGPGRLRKALAKEPTEGAALWSTDLQAKLAKQLGIDMLVLSEVNDYRFTKQQHQQSFFFGSTRYTTTTYHVTVAVRLVEPLGGKLMYAGRGSASSTQGYGPALAAATEAALQELKQFLASQRK